MYALIEKYCRNRFASSASEPFIKKPLLEFNVSITSGTLDFDCPVILADGHRVWLRVTAVSNCVSAYQYVVNRLSLAGLSKQGK